MRPSLSLPSRPAIERVEEGRTLTFAGLLSLVLLTIILLAGPSVLGAVRPWIELPILGGVTLLLLIQAGRLSTCAPLGSLRQIDAIDLSVILFTMYAVIRWRTSPTEFYSRFEVLSVIGYAVIFLFCRYGMPRRKYGVTLIILLVALGLFEVIFGYLLHLHSNPGDPSAVWYPFGPTEQMQLHWAPRWIGTYGCPNHYACLLVMATGAALALGCFSRYAWPARIVFLYVAALLLVGILYSESRGSWFSLIGALIALIFFALRYGALRWWIPLTGAGILTAIMVTIFLSSHVVERRVDEMTDTVESGRLDNYLRVELIEDALRIAHDHPFFGTGPATYTFVDPRYQGNGLSVRAVFTHNDYLNCLDDYGMIGFAIAMFFVFAVTLALGTQIRENSRWTERVLVATALIAWCALLVHSCLDFNMHIPANATMIFALTGMALARKPGEDAPSDWSTVSLARFGPWLGGVLALFGLLYGAEVGRTALSDFPYEHAQADDEVAPTAQSIRGMEKSLAFDSGNVDALTLLGDLHRVRAARATNDEERMTEGLASLDAYQKALKANPLDDSIRERMGLTYDLLERYTEAYLCYQAAIKAQPFNGGFWMVLANHLLDRGFLDKAEQAYATAATCPFGREGAAEAEKRLQSILRLTSFLPSESADKAPAVQVQKMGQPSSPQAAPPSTQTVSQGETAPSSAPEPATAP